MKPLLFFILILHFGNPLQSLTPTDSMKIKTLRDVQVSPDLQSALFTVSEAVENKNSFYYQSRIYQSHFHRNRDSTLLTPSLSSSFQPRWSPDGQWIAFLTPVDNIYQLYIFDVKKRTTKPLFSAQCNVQNFAWSPDSQKIAFVMSESTSIKKPLLSSFNHSAEDQVNKLWIIDLVDSEPRAYTSENYCVRGIGDFSQDSVEFSWSPDSQKIVFAHSPSSALDDFYLDSRLAMLDIKTGLIRSFEKKAQHESTPVYSPDGKWIAYLASEPPNYALNKRVNLVSSDGTEHLILPSTFNCGAELSERMLLGWNKESTHLIFFEPKKTKNHLLYFPIQGDKWKEFETQNWMIQRPCLNTNSQAIGFISQSVNEPQEAYVTRLNAFNPIQISQMNLNFKHACQVKTECIHWKSNDGLEIEGLLTYPQGYQKNKAYPLVLMIHGGPMSFFDQSFIGNPNFYCSELLAENGFLVLRPNPRGSTGYGKEFRCLNFSDWGGKDFEDLMSGVNKLVKKKLADPEKLGVMGWSYGGYLTARAITQTSRFKAAIIGAGICNLVSFAGTSDLPRFASSYLGEFWHQPDLYQKRSPIYDVHHVATPCLIIHGLNDLRVPTSQSLEFYQALKKNHQTVKMILIPEMAHGFNHPQKLKEIMQENLNWFQRYLKTEGENDFNPFFHSVLSEKKN